MSQFDSFKSIKISFSQEKKNHCDVHSIISRTFLLITLILSISLTIYTSFFTTVKTQFNFLNIPETKNLAPKPSSSSSSPTNISHIIFNLASSLHTWNNRRQYSALWWDSNATRGFIWLNGHPNTTTSIPYRVSSSEWRKFKYKISSSAVRIARIVVESFKLGLYDVRWFVMGDDDTVFFPENLVKVLEKYDHNEMWYVGGNSESIEQDDMHAYDMAFGGGGFAVSYGLAAELVNVLDGCLDRYYKFYGSDQRVWACIKEIGVPLTREVGFHQFDIRGSPYGILSAHPQSPLLSLHHLDYVSPLFPNQTQIESVKSLIRAYKLDPPRILQQTIFYDHKRKWSISISWGYTIQIYPSLIWPKDLQMPLQTFKTWRTWRDGPFTFNTRPMKPEPCDQPVVYFLDGVHEVGSSGTRTYYSRYVGKKCERAEYARVMDVQTITISAIK